MSPLRAVVVPVFTSVLLLTIAIPQAAIAQMPPHPRVKQLVERGQINTPYTLRNLDALRARGIDGAWTAPALQDRIQAAPGRPARTLGPALAPEGSWRALVILVDFSDKTAQVAASSFDNLLFGTASGSMRDYFSKVSYGALDIVTVHLPGTIGWKRAPRTYSYYCDGQNGFGTYPRNVQKLTEDVVNAANAAVDFSQYDNDGDGYVDALFIAHAGPGAEYTGNDNDIWSHAWVTSAPMSVDGKYVYRYSMEPEYWLTPGDMTIGVYAHELGHAAFGLPDLYDTDYSSEGVGDWSLMAGGSWNGPSPGGAYPAFPDVWSHMQMGYVTPATITTNITGASLRQIETYAEAWKLWTDGAPGSQYFLVENRQQTGYDTYLPGSGLLIYHVDEAVSTDNDKEWYPGYTSSGHYLVALEQADGQWHMEKGTNRGDGGDPFPGTVNRTSFTTSTTPDSKSYTGAVTGVALRAISVPGSTMTADLEISSTAPSLTLVSPNGGEGLTAGATFPIEWDALNITGSVTLEYSTNNGSSWLPIADVGLSAPVGARAAIGGEGTAEAFHTAEGAPVLSSQASTHSYTWTVPETPSAECRVRVSFAGPPALTDQSDAAFRILAPVPGLWGVQFNYDAEAVTGNNGNAGVVYMPDGREFWTSRWSTNVLHRWTVSGTLIETFSVTNVTGIRGMTYDGTYIYAAANNSTISVINPSTKTRVATITAPFDIRYITFDPTADGGAGGFWVGSFTSAATLISRSGTTLRTIPYASLNSASNYAAAFDAYSEGGPYLWFFGQGTGAGTPQRIVQVEVATGLPTGREHDVVTDVAAGISQPLAGGLFVAPDIVAHTVTIGGIVQGVDDHLFGYYLTPMPSTQVKALLQGPYSASTLSMQTGLRTSGVLADHFPGAQIPDAAVDSITIEARNAPTAAAATVRVFAPAWLLADGTVRMFTDTSRSAIDLAVPAGTYHIVVHHRNHIPVMSAAPVAVGAVPVEYDFTTAAAQCYGGDAASLGGGRYGLYAGDVDVNGGIGASDLASTRSAIGVLHTYAATDADLNGGVGATDLAIIRVNVGRLTSVP